MWKRTRGVWPPLLLPLFSKSLWYTWVSLVLGEVNFVIRKSVAELRLLSWQFALSALEHKVYDVRETAVRIILDLYRQHPALTLEHLPPEDSNTRRNLLYKAIFEGIAKIDGRPTEAEVRVSASRIDETAVWVEEVTWTTDQPC